MREVAGKTKQNKKKYKFNLAVLRAHRKKKEKKM